MTMKKIFLFIACASLLGSCNYLDVEPKGQVIPHTVADYRAMLTSAYASYPDHKTRLLFPSDEAGDIASDFGQHSGTLQILTWRANSAMAREYTYIQFYKVIFYANEVIDKILTADNDVVSGDVATQERENKQQILAEAYALRAYCYFDLLNMYAKWYDPATAVTDKGVPVTTIIDIKQKFPRSTVAEGYKRVLDDIAVAHENMQVDVQGVNYTYRFSKRALNALEARIRLYRSEWDEAFSLAQGIIAEAGTAGFELVDMVANPALKPYSSTSSEMILPLERVFQGLLSDRLGAYLSDNIVGMYHYTDDARMGKYIKSTELNTPDFMCYRDVYRCEKQDDKVSFRLSEIYLIAAEAALKKDSPSVSDARTYLGALQAKRIGTPPDLNVMNSDQLLSEIEQERVRELICEGHRWFDLRRTTRPAITKKLVVKWFFDFDVFEEVMETESFTLMANDPRYILPFPRSAKESNPYLND